MAPFGGDTCLQPSEFSKVTLDYLSEIEMLFTMVPVWSLFFGLGTFFEFDECLNMQSPHGKVLDKLP